MNWLLFVGYLMHVDVLMYNDVLLVFKSFILKKLKIVQFQLMFSECYIIWIKRYQQAMLVEGGATSFCCEIFSLHAARSCDTIYSI